MPFGTNGNDTLNASFFDSTSLGFAGNDLLIGHFASDFQDGGADADIILGLGGNDTYIFDAADLLYDGGANSDTVQVRGDVLVNLTDGVHLRNVETIDLNDGVANSVDAISAGGGVDRDDVIAMTDSSNTLRIEGEVGDSITLNSAEWALVDVVGGFEIYQGIEPGVGGGLVTMEVDAALNVVI